MSDTQKLSRKLAFSIFLVIVLLVCFVLTTYALVTTTYQVVNENKFETGSVGIKLEDVDELDVRNWEPGAMLRQRLTVHNVSGIDVYYKMYFESVTGGLAGVTHIKVSEEQSGFVLYEGSAADFLADNSALGIGTLAPNEQRRIVIEYVFEKDAANDVMGYDLSIVIGAKAVQVRNNPEKEFN